MQQGKLCLVLPLSVGQKKLPWPISVCWATLARAWHRNEANLEEKFQQCMGAAGQVILKAVSSTTVMLLLVLTN